MSIERELLERWIIDFGKIHPDIELMKETKELLAQPKQEPAAWIIETEIYGKLSEWVCTDKKHYMEAHDAIKAPIPLYTAPQKREPLSDETIAKLWGESYSGTTQMVRDFSRAIEKAHGIGGGDE